MWKKKSQSTGREKWNVLNEISPDVFVSIAVDDFETNPFTIRPIARIACPTTILFNVFECFFFGLIYVDVLCWNEVWGVQFEHQEQKIET